MAKLISVANLKGGVGKTTLVFNLAHAMQQHKKKVLMVDMDFQSNLTDTAMKNIKNGSYTSMYDVFVDKNVYMSMAITESVIDGVDLVPSAITMKKVPHMLDPTRDPRALHGLAEKIDKSAREHYDYILFDLRPDIDAITLSALLASDAFFIPVLCDRHSLQGIHLMDEYLEGVRHFNKNMQDLGILLNNLDNRTVLGRQMRDILREKYGDRVMSVIMHTNQALSTGTAQRKTIFQFDRREHSATTLMALAQDLILRLGDTVDKPKEYKEYYRLKR